MHKVTITSTGEEFSLPNNSYLTDAEELEVTGLVFGCRSGACGICAIEITDGWDNVTQADEDESAFVSALGYEAENVRLACQCQLRGNIAITPK